MNLCRSLGAVVILCALAFSISATGARPRHKQPGTDSQAASQCVFDNSGRQTCPGTNERTTRHARVIDANGNDARPRAWCGWQMRKWLGVADRAFNVARRWARYGTNAHGPAVGALVVWPHHVGLITGRTATGFVVKSGNDGHAVRERERSLRGAIAFRWPNGMASR